MLTGTIFAPAPTRGRPVFARAPRAAAPRRSGRSAAVNGRPGRPSLAGGSGRSYFATAASFSASDSDRKFSTGFGFCFDR